MQSAVHLQKRTACLLVCMEPPIPAKSCCLSQIAESNSAPEVDIRTVRLQLGCYSFHRCST